MLFLNGTLRVFSKEILHFIATSCLESVSFQTIRTGYVKDTETMSLVSSLWFFSNLEVGYTLQKDIWVLSDDAREELFHTALSDLVRRQRCFYSFWTVTLEREVKSLQHIFLLFSSHRLLSLLQEFCAFWETL